MRSMRSNEEVLTQVQEAGIAVPSSTTLNGRFAIRVAITNHRTRREDLGRAGERRAPPAPRAARTEPLRADGCAIRASHAEDDRPVRRRRARPRHERRRPEPSPRGAHPRRRVARPARRSSPVLAGCRRAGASSTRGPTSPDFRDFISRAGASRRSRAARAPRLHWKLWVPILTRVRKVCTGSRSRRSRTSRCACGASIRIRRRSARTCCTDMARARYDEWPGRALRGLERAWRHEGLAQARRVRAVRSGRADRSEGQATSPTRRARDAAAPAARRSTTA